MKFQTAVAALAAIENLSLVSSHETKSLGQSAWKDVNEVLSNHGKMMRERTNHLQDKLQKLSPTDDHQLGEKDKQTSLRTTTSDGDALDLGILVSSPIKNEPGTPIQTKEEYEGKNPWGLNLRAATREKALRSLQTSNQGYENYEASDYYAPYDLNDIFKNPLANQMKDYCGFLTGIASEQLGIEVCDVCGVVYPEDPETGLPGIKYNIGMDCPNLPPSDYTEYSLGNLNYACEVYCDTCNVDVENFVVDLQGCYIAPPDIDFNDAFTRPIAFAGEFYCPYLSEVCEVCEVVYSDVPDTGTYSLNMDCPNVEDEELAEALQVFEELNGLCMACQTCSVDTENLIATMQDCSFENYMNNYLGNYQGEIDGTIDADPETTDMDLGDLDSIVDSFLGADPEGIRDEILDEIFDADPETATDVNESDMEDSNVGDEANDNSEPEPPSEESTASEKEPVPEVAEEGEPESEASEAEPVEAEPATEKPVEAEPATEELVESEPEPASDTSEASSLSETSASYSFGRKSTTVGFVMLTMATASAVQILLGWICF